MFVIEKKKGKSQLKKSFLRSNIVRLFNENTKKKGTKRRLLAKAATKI